MTFYGYLLPFPGIKGKSTIPSSESSPQLGASHDYIHFGNWSYVDHPHLLSTPRMVFLSSTPTCNYTITAKHKQKLSPLLKVDASYGGSKLTRILVPKVHINGKINITMEKNVKNQC